jgi:biotin synthase
LGEITDKCLAGGLLERADIGRLLAESRNDPLSLFPGADAIRRKFFGKKIRICSIIPGRLGGCDQDCRFCAQSARYKTPVKQARTLGDEEILDAARQAFDSGVRRFGIVYSGSSPAGGDFERLLKLVGRIRSLGMEVCASAGMLSASEAGRLAEAGLTGYNHNLDTSERFFPSVVTTHSYGQRTSTVETVKQAGLAVCAGGIFGIGENDDDRVEMALRLRSLRVDTVPMNFLHPIDGTPLASQPPLPPLEILRIIAVYRYVLPAASLKVAGGRVLNLRDLQSWMFYAGANSILSGNYLTTAGRPVAEDVKMIRDLGLEPE